MANTEMKVTDVRAKAMAEILPLVQDCVANPTAIGNQEFVVETSMVHNGKPVFVKVALTVCDFIGTKTRAPFDLQTAVAKYAAEQAEDVEKAETKAKEKAEKEAKKAAEKAAKASK